MRHGANIPDIRALQAFLSSIDTNVQDIETLLGALVAASAASVDISAGAVELDPYKTRRLAQPDVARMTVQNPSAGTFFVGEYDAQTVEVGPGDAVTVDNNAGRPIYVTAAGRRATAFARVERNTTGTYTPTLTDVVTLAGGSVATETHMGFDSVVLWDLPAGDYFQAFNLSDGSSAFTYDPAPDVFDPVDFAVYDTVRGGDNFMLATDGDSAWTVNARRGVATRFDFLDPIDFLIPIRTEAFQGYVIIYTDFSRTLSYWSTIPGLDFDFTIPDNAEPVGQGAKFDPRSYTNNYLCLKDDSTSTFYYIRHGYQELNEFPLPGNYDTATIALGNDRAYFLDTDEDLILRLDLETGLTNELPYHLSHPDAVVNQDGWVLRFDGDTDRNYFPAGELDIRGFGGRSEAVIPRLGVQFHPGLGDDLVDMLDGSVLGTLSTSLSHSESVYDPRTDRVLLLDGTDYVLATIDLGWDPTP